MFELNKIAPGIEVYENCFENLDSILDTIKKFNFSYIDRENRKVGVAGSRKDELPLMDENFVEVWNTVENSINKCVEKHQENYHFNGIETEGISFLKYGLNNHFDFHLDENFDVPRTTSITVYFNEDFSGGEIEYEHFNIKFKPKAGSIAVFSSSYPYRHKVHPVTDGTRYAAVAWFRWKTLVNFYPQTETQDRKPY